MNYYIVTRNPIARAGIIRRLMEKGYSLFGGYTVSDYFTKWPAQTYPVVLTRLNTRKELVIDLMEMKQTNLLGADYSQVKNVNSIPNLYKSNVAAKLPNKTVAFPTATKYSLTYQKASGEVGNYTISAPIEANNESIVAYAFGRGIRTFKKSRVRSFSKTC